MKVGILGSGDVGKTLAAGFLKHDHAVMIGTRTPEKLAEWGRKNARGRVGGFDEAAKFAEFTVVTSRLAESPKAFAAARILVS
jgi:8-hydroxy-5-deazaflavin:NADPH oxidoreductase